jgi:hypothetical protein
MRSCGTCAGRDGSARNIYGEIARAFVMNIQFANWDKQTGGLERAIIPDATGRIDLNGYWDVINSAGPNRWNFDFGLLTEDGVWIGANHAHNAGMGPMRISTYTESDYIEHIIAQTQGARPTFNTNVYCAVCEADWSRWRAPPPQPQPKPPRRLPADGWQPVR